mgnify:CR=1 FL=1|tara:strand:- start:930 stop:1985 length:1056 start_codon:yes stop_codon:yes gene_type:complete
MNQTKRFVFHILLWLVLWLFAWMLTEGDVNFLKTNSPSLFMQIVGIAVLIYYTAPALLLKKKYVLFAVVSLALIAFCAFVISNNFKGPIEGPSPFPDGLPSGNDNGPMPGRRPMAPPQILIHFLVISVAYVLATFIETFLFAQKKEEEIIRNQNENLQTELKLLKSQINPHFLFNALNNIYTLSAIDAAKTQQSISYLSDMLRYVLYECEQELVPLKKEIMYIKNYIKLFSLKSSKQYPIQTDFIVANENIKIAPMLFIPFMENALKHSNIEKITDTFIRMKILADDHEIRFEIENSISESPKVVDEVGGIGIENVKRRLAIVYPNRYKLLINETARAFKVNLIIDLNGND